MHVYSVHCTLYTSHPGTLAFFHLTFTASPRDFGPSSVSIFPSNTHSHTPPYTVCNIYKIQYLPSAMAAELHAIVRTYQNAISHRCHTINILMHECYAVVVHPLRIGHILIHTVLEHRAYFIFHFKLLTHAYHFIHSFVSFAFAIARLCVWMRLCRCLCLFSMEATAQFCYRMQYTRYSIWSLSSLSSAFE